MKEAYTNDCLCEIHFYKWLTSIVIVSYAGVMNPARELEAVGFYVGITPRLEG